MIKFIKKILLAVAILTISFGFFAVKVQALPTPIPPGDPNQTEIPEGELYIPLAPLPGTTLDEDPGAPTTLETYIPGLFKLLIGVAAALAVIMIVIGGIQYIGSESLFGKQDGREKIQKALMGLLLAIFAWLLLYSINPNLVSFDLSVPQTQFPQAQQQQQVPYTARVVYRIRDDPMPLYVGCGPQFVNQQECQNNLPQIVGTYPTGQNQPYTYAAGNCVTSCTPVLPPDHSYLKYVYHITGQAGPPRTKCYGEGNPAACQIALPIAIANQSTQHPNWTIHSITCVLECTDYP